MPQFTHLFQRESPLSEEQSRISSYVDLLFRDVPFSPMTSEARHRIDRAIAELPAETGFNDFVSLYPGLKEVAALAGFGEEDVASWSPASDLPRLKQVKRSLTAARVRIYAACLLFVMAFSYLLWTLFNLVFSNVEWPLTGLLAVASTAVGILILRSGLKSTGNMGRIFDADTHGYLIRLSDRYTKRLLNSIMLLTAVAALFIGAELSFYFFGNSKAAELGENIMFNIIVIQIPLFLVLKNAFCLHLVRTLICAPESATLRCNVFGIAIFSVAYWVIVLTLTVVFSNSLSYPANILVIAAAVYLALMLAYNLTLRRRLTRENLSFNKWRVLVCGPAVILACAFLVMSQETWYTQPYINSVPVVEHANSEITYDDSTGIYTITPEEDDFKILHLTDIHLGNSLSSYDEDLLALEACYAEIEATHPDLVIVTGDLCFPLGIMSMSFNNSAPVFQFAAFMRNIGIPWAFTYGNHDTESLASTTKEGMDAIFQSVSFKTSGVLLYPYVQPHITGRNNQLIEIRRQDGSLQMALFLLDSNAYTGEGINVYDYIHDDQVDWYADQVKRLSAEADRTVPSLVFFHIPLQEYRTAYELWEKGSDEVTYFFGENGEKLIDKVCCSDYPSKLFDTMVELGSTTGVFCGHDHYNNMSLEYRGIRLTYGMSIDYLVMPGIKHDTAQRGGELITVHEDGSWDLVQIPLTSITGEDVH